MMTFAGIFGITKTDRLFFILTNSLHLPLLLPAKSGMEPGDVVNVARHVKFNCPSLRLAGLMTIGSPNPDLENGENPDFKALNGCRTAIYEEKELNISDLELSMVR